MNFFNVIPLPYKIFAAVMLFFIVITSSIVYGYNKAENKYIAIIATYKSETELLQTKLNAALADVKVKVVTEYVDRIQTVKEKEYVYRDKIINVPSKCELSSGWVHLHDASATGGDADPSRVSDETPSGVRDTEALDTVVGNYSICQQNAEQLKALQKWVLEAQKEVERQNEEAKQRYNRFSKYYNKR